MSALQDSLLETLCEDPCSATGRDPRMSSVQDPLLETLREDPRSATGRDPRMKPVVDLLFENCGTNPRWAEHAEIWRPRRTPSGSVVLEIACTTHECVRLPEAERDRLRTFVEGSAALRFSQGYGLPGRVWASSSPEWTSDVRSVPPSTFLRSGIAVKHNLNSALGIPIASTTSTPELIGMIGVAVFFSASSASPSLEQMGGLGAAMRKLAEVLTSIPELPTPMSSPQLTSVESA
ncbi:hypothetical protein T492DRAFT_1109695 [Pavlovales sp. CCMP2436]|nr:hypothetical protein T492DRAFT_1109695 [Pavlovales sp. CCMP2436]